MELTLGNELDIAIHNDRFAKDDWPILVDWFSNCEALVSKAAWEAIHNFTSEAVEAIG